MEEKNGNDGQWNAPEVMEALRLINKFFPESKGFLTNETGIGIWNFISAMKLAEFGADFSCEPYGVPPGPDLGLSQKGGLDGDVKAVFARLLDHAGFSPSGRCVIIPDALGYKGWSQENLKPIVCHHKMAAQRIDELEFCLFDHSHDSLFIFESGEALAVDHDNRVYWAKSSQGKNKGLKRTPQ